MRKQNYYYMVVYYDKDSVPNEILPATGHVIRASSIKEAESIAVKHGISKPFHSQHIISRIFCEIDPGHNLVDEALIKRRRRGIGGKIWYENENGELMYEINQI